MHNLQQYPEEKLPLFEIKTLLLANLWTLFFSLASVFLLLLGFLNGVIDLPVYCLYRETSS